MIKKIIIIFICLLSINSVYAQEKLNEEKFSNYFQSKGYDINNFECMQTSQYDQNCTIISAINKKSNNKNVELYIFNSNSEAQDYFTYVYEDNINNFKNIISNNLDNSDGSNYSYIRTELSNLYYFYIVRVDNYIVKSNIDKNKKNVMDKIYDDLDLIPNQSPQLKKQTTPSNYLTIAGIILEVILIITLALLIKKKKSNKIIIAIIFLMSILLAIFLSFNLIELTKPDNQRIKEEYESLNNKKTVDGEIYPKVEINIDNKIHYTNSTEVLEIFEKNKSAVIFFGYPECLYCRNAIETLIDTSIELSTDVVYYFDTQKEDKNSKEYKKLINKLGNSFMDEDEIYAPTVIFVKNNGIVLMNRDTIEIHSNPYQEFNENFKNGLKEIYLYGFKLLND